MIQEIQLELFADYFQFYIQDEETTREIEDAWTQEELIRKLVVAKDQLLIGTARNMTVPVIIKIFEDSPPMLKNAAFSMDQINECDLETSSGKIVVAGCTDYYPEARRINLAKGKYRVRIYYCNLEKLSEDELEGEDFYEIHMWKVDELSGLKILLEKK